MLENFDLHFLLFWELLWKVMSIRGYVGILNYSTYKGLVSFPVSCGGSGLRRRI